MLVRLSSLQFVSQSWGMLNVSTSTFQASSGCAARFARLSQDTRFSESDMCRKTSVVARLLSRREVSLKFLNVHKASADRGASAFRLVFVRRKILPTILWVALLFGTASSTLLFTAFTHSKMKRRSSVGKVRSDIMKPSSEILPGDSGWVSKRPSPDGSGVQLIRHLAIYQIIRVGKMIVRYHSPNQYQFTYCCLAGWTLWGAYQSSIFRYLVEASNPEVLTNLRAGRLNIHQQWAKNCLQRVTSPEESYGQWIRNHSVTSVYLSINLLSDVSHHQEKEIPVAAFHERTCIYIPNASADLYPVS